MQSRLHALVALTTTVAVSIAASGNPRLPGRPTAAMGLRGLTGSPDGPRFPLGADAALGESAQAPRSATVLALGILPGHRYSSAFDVNEHGQVVVVSQDFDQRNHAALWDGGRLVALPELPGYQIGQPAALNSKAEVVGTCALDFSDYGRAVIWRRGHVTALPPLPGDTNCGAEDINDGGQVVGWSWGVNTGARSVVWEQGRVTPLPTLPSGGSLGASCINARGQVGGVGYSTAHEDHAFTIFRNNVADLGTLPNSRFTEVEAIDPRGNLAGLTLGDDDRYHAVYWPHGSPVELPKLAGDVDAMARGINARGLIVGDSFVNGGSSSPVIWDDANVIRFSTLVPDNSNLVVHRLEAINNRSQIAGSAYDQSQGKDTAVLITLRFGKR